MMPAAPARFSTMTCCPSRAPSLSAISRAAMSVVPPGAAGTIRVIGRSGQAAWAWLARANATAPAASQRCACIMLVSRRDH
ncbi:hypothetical protein G6F59_015885 [Rhizopus arrhizus]|nr:hypothetical protein G6F59_015885 [Rhizopus arrhizus]